MAILHMVQASPVASNAYRLDMGVTEKNHVDSYKLWTENTNLTCCALDPGMVCLVQESEADHAFGLMPFRESPVRVK